MLSWELLVEGSECKPRETHVFLHSVSVAGGFTPASVDWQPVFLQVNGHFQGMSCGPVQIHSNRFLNRSIFVLNNLSIVFEYAIL